MPSMTTIKVPTDLRDRLAERARKTSATSLAAALNDLLVAAEEQDFWMRVAEQHARLTDVDRASYVADPLLGDGLRNDTDEKVAARDAW